MSKPLCIDLFCGVGGFTEGAILEGYDCIGFDIERHVYGRQQYPAQLVIQDILTVHGSQFRDASLIWASPPCQAYSWMAMPWTLAKAKAAAIRADSTGKALADLNRLFDACFRLQKEASIAAGRHIPMVVENVRGAIPWVGRSRWNFGSFHLWGDVPALMPPCLFRRIAVPPSIHRGDGSVLANILVGDGVKGSHGTSGSHWTNPAERIHAVDEETGTKIGGDWFSDPQSTCRRHGSKSKGRKMASAMIAKIPLPLSRHIARIFHP